MNIHPYLTPLCPVSVSSKVQEKVGQVLKVAQPQMYKGETKITCNEEQVLTLVTAIGGLPGINIKDGHDFLMELLRYSNRVLGWNVPIINFDIHKIFDKDNVTLETFEEFARFRAVEEEFSKDLAKIIPRTIEERVGQILFSAIFYGLLLHKRCIKPFLRALNKRPCLVGDWLWMELYFEKADLPKGSLRNKFHSWHAHRRWVADPLTQILILRWIQDYPEDMTKLKKIDRDVWKKYFQRLKPKGLKITSLTSLHKIAKSRAFMFLPSFIPAYACGALPSVCFDEDTFMRLVEDKSVYYPEPVESLRDGEEEHRYLMPHIQAAQNVDSSKQSEMLRKFLTDELKEYCEDQKTGATRRRYPHEAISVLNEFRDNNQNQLTQTFTYLIEWSVELFKKQEKTWAGRDKKGPLVPGTVITYLRSIGYGLLDAAGKDDLVTIQRLDREQIYERTILYKKTEDSRIRAASVLNGFHGFLKDFHTAKDVDFDSIRIDAGIPTHNVNARIITPSDYSNVLEYLGFGSQILNRWQRMWIIAFILGFKTGLRRSEIISIRLVDYQNDRTPIIIICDHIYHHSKYEASKREIRLRDFLTDAELQFINDFFEFRMRETELEGGELLLSDSTVRPGLLPYSCLIGPVVDAMRTVTGNPKLTFHSLRHSYVTWLVVRLILRDDFDAGTSLKCLQNEFFDPQSLKQLHLDLLDNDQLSSQYLYATSILGGHASPVTTILNYFHLMDWSLGYYLRHPFLLPKLSVAAIQQVTGVGQTKAYEVFHKPGGLVELAKTVSKRFKDRFAPQVKYRLGRPPEKNSWHHSDCLLPWEDALKKLFEIQDQTPDESKGSQFTDKPDNEGYLVAAKMYQKAYGLDGRRFKKVSRVIGQAQKWYDPKGKSFLINNRDEAKDLFEALNLLGVEPGQMSLKFVPCVSSANRCAGESFDTWTKILTDEKIIMQTAPIKSSDLSQNGSIYLRFRRKMKIASLGFAQNRYSHGMGFFMDMFHLGSITS